LKVTVEVVRNPVPLMVSVCAVAPAASEAGDSEATVGMGLLGAVTVIVSLFDLVESCVEVAVTVSDPEAGTVAGDVYSPELEIVPETADQVTAEL
jgi:hypothetical protein